MYQLHILQVLLPTWGCLLTSVKVSNALLDGLLEIRSDDPGNGLEPNTSWRAAAAECVMCLDDIDMEAHGFKMS